VQYGEKAQVASKKTRTTTIASLKKKKKFISAPRQKKKEKCRRKKVLGRGRWGGNSDRKDQKSPSANKKSCILWREKKVEKRLPHEEEGCPHSEEWDRAKGEKISQKRELPQKKKLQKRGKTQNQVLKKGTLSSIRKKQPHRKKMAC